MPRPTVVVTRPAGQSRQLTEALQGAGLDVLGLPLLAIAPAEDDAPLRAALSRLDQFALVVFVSPNAVTHALDALALQQGSATAQWPEQVTIAVVGPASVAALAERGIAAPRHRVIAPAGAHSAPGEVHDNGAEPGERRFDSEALWAQLDSAALAGRQVLIVRGNGGRDWLGDRLREAGADVLAVEAYRRSCPEPGTMQWQAIRDALRPGAAPHAWLLTSSEAVRNLVALAEANLNDAEQHALRDMQCIVPHARIAEQADALGFRHVQLAAPGDDGLLAACLRWAEPYIATPEQAAPLPRSAPAAPAATPAAVPATPARAVSQPASPASDTPAAAPAQPSLPSSSTKVDRVTQQTSSASSTPPPTGAPPLGTTAPDAGRARRGGAGLAWLFVLLLALAAGGGFWWLQQRVDRLTEELARRQQTNDSLVQESRVLTREAQTAIKEMQAKVGALDAHVAETRDKQATLEQVYQDLIRNRDDWELAEIQQLLTNAAQQLQLTGNVQVALAALQSADVRLARSDKPEYNALRRAIARDIGTMKAMPDTDLTGAAIKLDEAINQIDSLPLLSSERMLERSEGNTPASAPAADAAQPAAAGTGGVAQWFAGLWDTVRDELMRVIRVRRVDNTDALLLTGDQGWFLRENVKLRLLNARLALLSRNEPVFRNDLAAAQRMIDRYFDTKSRRVQAVLTQIKQAQAGAVAVQLPTMAESLGALRALKKE